MRTQDLHELPKIRDSQSFLYVEHAVIDKEAQAISVHDAQGLTPVPCASLVLLMLGPGTKITHQAIMALADNGCLVAWCGEHAVRFYACGTGTTRSARHLLRQAFLTSHTWARLEVCKRMYRMRFDETVSPDLTLQQLRGMEGVRVRDAYAQASKATGVEWKGRQYDRNNWANADPVNRALSCANACLYGVSHAAIVAAGYSPGLGFVHTGKQLSFVYDVADFYKVETTIPVAFQAAATGAPNLEREVRYRCRDIFRETRLLNRIVDDIEKALDIPVDAQREDVWALDADPAAPGGLWSPDLDRAAPGGVNYGDPPEAPEEEDA